MNSKILQKIRELNNDELEKEILLAKKELFELRFKKATRQPFKSHLFSQIKYKLRLLLMFKENTENFKE